MCQQKYPHSYFFIANLYNSDIFILNAVTGCNSLLIENCKRGYRKSYGAIRNRGRVSRKALWHNVPSPARSIMECQWYPCLLGI